MKVASTGGSALQRHRQMLRDLATQEEARADGYANDAINDNFKAVDLKELAAKNRADGKEKADESNRLRRNGREQSLAGLKNLADGSDRYAESFAGTEKGLSDLQESLDGMTAAHDSKGQALEKINQGLDEQGTHNANQTETLNQFQANQDQDLALDAVKSEQLGELNSNQQARQEGFQRQLEGFGTYLIAGAEFDEASKVKRAGFQNLSEAASQNVKSERSLDARDHKNVEKTWAQTDQSEHTKTSKKLFFSSLFESMKAKAASLAADHLKAEAGRHSDTAEGMAAHANALKSQASSMLRQARHMEHCGQNHVIQGRQMQCCPFTYHQGVALERQGHCEIAEAQRLKRHAQSVRAEGQAKAMEAEALRVNAEQTLAKGEEFEVKGHGNATRAKILNERSDEHEADAEKAGQTADKAASAAEAYDKSARELKAEADKNKAAGQEKLNNGLADQDAALKTQATTGQALGQEFKSESELSNASKLKAAESIGTLVTERSFIRRGKTLLGELGTSHAAERESHGKIEAGIGEMESGLDASKTSNDKGLEAAKLLEEARTLELEGLRLQNCGQKMMLEARPKMAAAARLSAESFDHLKSADSQETEAAKLIEQGQQKMAAAEILREKAAGYRELAG